MTKFIRAIVLITISIMQFGIMRAESEEMHEYSGLVTDGANGEGIPFASVFVRGTTIGTLTDEEGRFLLKTSRAVEELSFSFIGYREKTVKVRGEGLVGNVRLEADNMLKEVVVRNRRVRYKRKGNAAVDFVKRVLERKDSMDARSGGYYSARCYRKQTFGTMGVEDMRTRFGKKGKDMSAFERCVDTSEVSGVEILPLYTEEAVAELRYDEKKMEERGIMEEKRALFDIIPEEIFSTIMADAGGEVNIYDNSFRLLFTDFISPIASYGKTFYHYYITDTLKNPYGEGKDYVKVNFAPTNKESLGFAGYMLVAKDSTYGIRELDMTLSHASRINFVKGMVIRQEFERGERGYYTLRKSALVMEGTPVGKVDNRSAGLYAKIERYYSPYSFDKEEGEKAAEEESEVAAESWEEYMPDNAPERDLKDITDLKEQLGASRLMRFINFTFKTLTDGHVPIGDVKKPKLHLGPIYSITTSNHLEGRRVLLGAETGTGLHKRWFAGGYCAYGFKDKRMKGWGEVEYSFVDKDKSRYEFPRRSVAVTFLSDCDMPANRYASNRGESFLAALTWQDVKDYSYYKRVSVSHIWEFDNGLNYSVSLRHNVETAADELVYNYNGSGEKVKDIETIDYCLTLGFQPNVFQQLGLNRFAMTDQVPHITLTYMGASDKLGSDYTYNKTEINYNQRFTVSPAGYMDVFLGCGKVWNKAPYPLLFTPPTKLSYVSSSQSFSMMSSMEFIYDQYVMAEVDHYMEGWFLSKIPLIKKLKLRELWKFKVMTSGLTKKNNPKENPEDNTLFSLPERSYVMNKPYMEASFGVYNIFRLLQVEVVRRINYLEHPYARKWGCRFGIRIGF